MELSKAIDTIKHCYTISKDVKDAVNRICDEYEDRRKNNALKRITFYMNWANSTLKTATKMYAEDDNVSYVDCAKRSLSCLYDCVYSDTVLSAIEKEDLYYTIEHIHTIVKSLEEV